MPKIRKPPLFCSVFISPAHTLTLSIVLFGVYFLPLTTIVSSRSSHPNPVLSHYPVYCKANGFCHVPGLPDSCTRNSECQTPWYNSYCQSGGSCHLLPPPKCKVDSDCNPPGVALEDIERHVEVAHINSLPNITWKAKVHDRFVGQPLGAARQLCGVSSQAHTILQDAVKTGKVTVYKHDPTLKIPDSFDSETNWPHCQKVIGDIRDRTCMLQQPTCICYNNPRGQFVYMHPLPPTCITD